MHPHCRAVSPCQAQWPRIHVNPINGLLGQPSSWCTIEPHQRPWRERRPHLKSCTCLNVPSWFMMHLLRQLSHTLEQSRKRRLSQLQSITLESWGKNGEARHSGKVFQHKSKDWWENERRPTVSLTSARLKNVNSEIGSEAQVSYLERYSPKGSCHHDESSMSHTLAQNCHVEFCCGMHLTCKHTPIKIPDRNGSVKRPERKSRGHHRHSQCKMKGVWSWPFPFNSQIVPTLTDCENRTEIEMDIGNSKLTSRRF